MHLCEFWKIQDFEIFCPPWLFGKISFLTMHIFGKFWSKYFLLVEMHIFWCPKVPWVLKNASMKILKDSRVLRFFMHRGHLGKFHFW